jgi:hypothetical protein
VSQVVSRLSYKVISFDDLSSSEPQGMFRDTSLQYVTIKWSEAPANKVEVAQLDSGLWYYTHTPEGELPVLFGLDHIDDVLRDYDLTFPELKGFGGLMAGVSEVAID